ncbi:response regulator transcription factor [Anabaena sp. FACHB-1237]|uniref:response regulator transcription factor n=1 Tax=Anabaena sp. FACHB-1237 TaxID=2692769 RepID=UPI0016816AEF|nr:response regulator transcription factor [Anabaena sp. FACHB-1237]MBD2138135.1 response regulator transcription factor [Anabaena sp. FACHB-1237]
MSKIRVALIEDHELTRVNTRISLLQQDYIEIVGEAENAHQGLGIIQKFQPDIAIVDIGLPDQDGIELTRQIKAIANRKNWKIKVLILTLYNNQQSVLAAFAAGADSYCMKDNEFEHLSKVVQVTNNGNSWIDPVIASIVLEQARKNSYQLESTSSETRNFIIDSTSTSSKKKMPTKPYIVTDRELEVLQLIVEGCSNAVIAQKLYISIGTVKSHVRNIMNKLSANDRTQAAVAALRSGLVA